MLPPETTATGVVVPGSSSRWYSHAATAAAPPGSATSRAWFASSRTAASISSSVTVTMSATSALMCANGSSPTCSTRSASATVRWTSAAGQLTRSPRCRDSRASAARAGSTPTTAAAGQAVPHGRRDARDEAAAADRHQDQPDLRAVGRDLQADGALAGDDRPVVERRDRHVPVPGRQFRGGGHARRQGRLDPHQLGAVVLDRVRLDLRRRPRDHHDCPHAEQGGGVGHRVTVVAAGMGDDSVPAGGLLAGRDRGVRAAQLERPRGLQRLGLDQKRRLEPGHRDQRCADRHPLEPPGRVLYLGQADQLGSGPSYPAHPAANPVTPRAVSPRNLADHHAPPSSGSRRPWTGCDSPDVAPEPFVTPAN